MIHFSITLNWPLNNKTKSLLKLLLSTRYNVHGTSAAVGKSCVVGFVNFGNTKMFHAVIVPHESERNPHHPYTFTYCRAPSIIKWNVKLWQVHIKNLAGWVNTKGEESYSCCSDQEFIFSAAATAATTASQKERKFWKLTVSKFWTVSLGTKFYCFIIKLPSDDNDNIRNFFKIIVKQCSPKWLSTLSIG